METLILVGVSAIVILLAYVAVNVREAILRLTIIDVRLRIMEPLLSNPDVNDSNYLKIRQELYNKYFSELYVGTYDQIVRLAYKEIDMGLSWLKPSKQIEQEVSSKTK
jgi:hypothetical protein